MAEVGIAQLRRELKDWLDRLADEGRLSEAPAATRPTARSRPRVTADGEVSARVVAERESRR